MATAKKKTATVSKIDRSLQGKKPIDNPLGEKALPEKSVQESPYDAKVRKVAVTKAGAAKQDKRSAFVPNLSSWTREEKQKVLELYIEGNTMPKIAAAVGKGVSTVRHYINAMQRSLTNTKQTRMLPMMTKLATGAPVHVTDAHAREYNLLKNPELINEEFFQMLSAPDSDVLTEAEEKFCWAYVSSMDLEEAIYSAGLDAGLYEIQKAAEDKSQIPVKGFDSCIKMRIAYLKAKPNLSAFIKKLQEDVVLTVEVGKDFLQREILTQIEALKLSHTFESKKLLRDYIMMLGKTFGGFVDTVQVEEIDHAKTVQKLLAQAQRNKAAGLDEAAKKAQAALDEAAAERAAEEKERNEQALRFSPEGSPIQ